ncbi:MAG TPA: EAL domain-containing protein [Novimethylophilus sp.]|jgi:diguanylate cyclase (GGDEF)-like protein|uniref:putative bifunctional diguanylate cyclase/phosphodiesterase n=1 Tax=Novimethylophilus sp. TaxID=2137426 RepID=UPI002F3EEEF4
MNVEPINILLVEDNPGDIRLVTELLAEGGDRQFNLLAADRLESALLMLERHDITAILLDLLLPDGTGLETLYTIHAAALNVPIVVLSNLADERLAVQSVQYGAQDFLVKDHVNSHLLMRSLRYAIERKRMEERLNHLAHHDSLTGLSNRKHFYDRLKNAMALARRQESQLALLLLDLNDFKPINDTLGHHVGDLLLQGVAQRLRECIRETDCVARIGGDEFTMILTGMRSEEDAVTATCKIMEAMQRPFLVNDFSLDVSVSIGISLYPSDADNLETLVRHADTAMYQAKAESNVRNAYRFYSSSMHFKASEERELQHELSNALARSEFTIDYQPQVDVRTGRINGMESLLRWRHPQRGLLLPGQFINALESSPLILEVGEWVLRTACTQSRVWQETAGAPVMMSVNLASRQLMQENFADMVAAILQETGLAPQWLELDIPEHALWEDEERAFEQVSKLNLLGVKLALDNFGNGRASFYYLRKFPFHAIKLDRRLTQDASTTAEGADLARAVIQIAHVFRMKGQAGGVETAEQLDVLRDLACDDAQGYLYCHPLPSEAATELLQRGQCLEPAAG